MNTQIKSHWRLARKAFVKALRVTFSVPYRNYKARRFMLSIDQDLHDQRKLFAVLDPDSNALDPDNFDIWQDRIKEQSI